METEKSIVKMAETKLPKFVEDAYDSIEKMESFAKILLDSRLVPHHFYEQTPEKKPDFTKGKIPAVVAVLIQGYQLQLPPLTALQHIIPVNGLLSIKGDLAKSMIFNSGKLKAGSWVEEETGSIDEGNLVVKITATRSDNGQTLSRSFSVAQAKRAGLWITEQQVNGPDGWKYKASAWWKYPARMINYRALGFLARDMFPDVMAGIYTTEEAMDLPKDTVEVIETPSGATITIPDKEHAKKRSDKMTDRVVGKIPDNKFAPIQEAKIVDDTVNVPDQPADWVLPSKEMMESAYKEVVSDNKEESPFVPSSGSVEYMDGKEVSRTDVPGKEGDLTLAVMEKMETKDLLAIINKETDMIEALELIPGKNTNKKCRDIIYAFQRGVLTEHTASLLRDETGQKQGVSPEEVMKGEIPVNKDFDKQGEPKGTPVGHADILLDEVTKNKYGILIPELGPEGKRDFSTVKSLFNALNNVTPTLNSARYVELATKKGLITVWQDKESFLKSATTKMVNELLDMN